MDSLQPPAVGPHSILPFEVIHCKGVRVELCAHRKTNFQLFEQLSPFSKQAYLQGQRGQSWSAPGCSRAQDPLHITHFQNVLCLTGPDSQSVLSF